MKLLALDAFGTIIKPVSNRAYTEMLFPNIPELSPGKIRTCRNALMTEPLSTDQLFDRFVAQHTAEMKHRFDALLLEDLESAECYEDTIPFLREMRRRELMVIVISNLATPYVELFERLGIRELVDAVFSSCAEDVRMRKPNPKLFELALPAGIQPHEALMLGDKFANDVQGPMDCGWSALHLVREDSHQAPVDPHKTIQGLFEAIPYL